MTTVSFGLPQTGDVKLVIYNELGREVARLADQVYPAGSYQLTLDGRSLPSGVYFAHLEFASLRQTQKLVLLK